METAENEKLTVMGEDAVLKRAVALLHHIFDETSQVTITTPEVENTEKTQS